MNYEEINKRLESNPDEWYTLFESDFEDCKAGGFLSYLASNGAPKIVLTNMVELNWNIWKDVPYEDWLTAFKDLKGTRMAVTEIAVIYYKYFGIDSVKIVLESDVFTAADKQSVRWHFDMFKRMFVQSRVRQKISAEQVKEVQDRLVAEGAPKAPYLDPDTRSKGFNNS